MLIPSCAPKQMWRRGIFSHVSGCKIDFIIIGKSPDVEHGQEATWASL